MPIPQQEQSFQSQLSLANEKLVGLEKKLHALDGLLADHLAQRAKYHLLDEISASLDKLGDLGGDDLFWAGSADDREARMHHIRGAISGYRQKLSSLEKMRGALLDEIPDVRASIRTLNDQIAQAGRQKKTVSGYPVAAYRSENLPWSGKGDEEQLFHRILLALLLIAVLFGGLVPVIKPPVEQSMGVVVPERIAKLIKKKQQAKPAISKPAQGADEQAEEKMESPSADKNLIVRKAPPTESEVRSARSTAESKGVLAFKNNFADMMEDTVSEKAGAGAHISVNANRASGQIQKKQIVMSQAILGSSGGIDTTTLDRKSVAEVTQRIASVEAKFSRVESATGSAMPVSGRSIGKDGKPARTDEDIQIVFDKYKSTLYRIYNRELRNNPTLRGRMVLRIVIEPDGRVSSCTVNSTDLASPALSADIVDRVLKFNFGAKEGVPTITILYPIDFMPAN